MVYLKSFELLNDDQEINIISYLKKTTDSVYPLKIFPAKEFKSIDFNPITIFYGGNGSGKTTLLNIIATKIEASRKSINAPGDTFDTYVRMCNASISRKELKEIKVIFSEDVYDYLIDTKSINAKINRYKDDLAEEYLYYKYTDAQDIGSSLEQIDELKNKVDANRVTQSKYIRARLRNNVIIQESNGETALDYWQNEIKDHAIYIIDEPENSLSSENQLNLKKFIEDSARFYDCQFIIATHSPFLLSLMDAKVYDLDSVPVKVKKWTELPNVRTYYEFFKDNKSEFELGE